MDWYHSIQDPAVASSVAEGLLGSIARRNPAAALEMAATISEEAKPKAYHSLIRNWAFSEPVKAAQWIQSLPPDPARDAAVIAYVSVIDGNDAAAATKWAYSIQDPAQRLQHTVGVFERWLQNDRAGAQDWVQNMQFPEGIRPVFDRLLQGKR